MATHCGRGHLLDEEGSYTYTYGSRTRRYCKACIQLRTSGAVTVRPPRPLPERVWARSYINRLTGCVVWMGATTKKGYGHLRMDDKWHYVHRVTYEATIGPIPEGMTVDHLCWNPRCVAPAHMELCTRSENSTRRSERS